MRDELYCQLVRMTTDNPAAEDQLCRLWTLLCLCAVSFSPSRTLRKVPVLSHTATVKLTSHVTLGGADDGGGASSVGEKGHVIRYSER